MSNRYEEPFIPLPRFQKILERKFTRDRGKLKSMTYKFSGDIAEPNFGLLYNLLPDIYLPENFKPQNGKEKDEFEKVMSSNKLKWLEFIVEHQPSPKITPKFDLPQYLAKKEFKATTAQPLIIGLGEASPYETGITLDFLTGLPIIPGSALKGITRRAAILNLAWQNKNKFNEEFKEKFGFELNPVDDAEYSDLLPYGEEFDFVASKIEEKIKPTDYIEIFGTQDRKGKVIFMDAYPVSWENAPNGKLFKVDIMNPHYGPYYSTGGWDKKEGKPVPPADWYDPNPIFYLTVNEWITYRFILASRDKDLLDIAINWLKYALENIGVGAKDNQGYGIFKIERKES